MLRTEEHGDRADRRSSHQSIGHREDPRANGDLLRLQASRITAAVATLMMSENDFRGVRKERDAFDQVVSDLCVALHDRALFIGKRPRFKENCVRYRQFADVVQPRSHGDVSHLIFQAAQRLGNLDGVQKYAPGMSCRRAVPQIDRRAENFERVVIAALDLAQSFSKLLCLFRDNFLEMMAVVFDFLFQPASRATRA